MKENFFSSGAKYVFQLFVIKSSVLDGSIYIFHVSYNITVWKIGCQALYPAAL